MKIDSSNINWPGELKINFWYVTCQRVNWKSTSSAVNGQVNWKLLTDQVKWKLSADQNWKL